MHGHKRSEYKAHQRDPKVAAKLGAKAEQWRTLDAQLVRIRREPPAAAATAVIASDVAAAAAAADSKTLALIAKMLTVNPDPLTLWNHRRELLVRVRVTVQHTELEKDQNQAVDVDVDSSSWKLEFELAPELELTQTALQNNPKAYGAWFHRKWCLQQWLSSHATATDIDTTLATDTDTAVATLLEQELELTVMFLQRDERNFHCWNYRRFIVACLLQQQQTTGTTPAWDGSLEFATAGNPAGTARVLMGAQVASTSTKWTTTTEEVAAVVVPMLNDAANATTTTATILQREWDFCGRKILDNFSNFSAFHYRSKLLPWMLRSTAAMEDPDDAVRSVWTTEFQLVENAIFTEPDDQTAWWYHRFLLDTAVGHVQTTGTTSDWYSTLLQQQQSQLQELVEEVADSKWAWLGLLLVLERLHQHNNKISSDTDIVQEQADILQKLIILDPDRQARYQHLWKKTQTIANETQ